MLVVSGDSSWAQRLAAAARSAGLATVRLRDARALAGYAGGAGVTVLDWGPGAASLQARRWAGFVRRDLPDHALAFAVERGDLAADALTQALAQGADGVLDKDGAPAVLAAQLRALCRRAAAAARERGLLSPRGDLRFDPARGLVFFRSRGLWRPGPALAGKEAGLLRFLLESPGRVLDRADLLEALWCSRGGDVNGETLDKQAASLRRKLGARGRALRTVRGRGYRWD